MDPACKTAHFNITFLAWSCTLCASIGTARPVFDHLQYAKTSDLTLDGGKAWEEARQWLHYESTTDCLFE